MNGESEMRDLEMCEGDEGRVVVENLVRMMGTI